MRPAPPCGGSDPSQGVGWDGVKVGGGGCPHLGSCKRCQPGREGPKVGVKCFEASSMSDILNINTLTPLAAAITSSKTKLILSELSTVDFDPLKNL